MMTQNEDIQNSGTLTDYLMQKLIDEQTGEKFAIEYLKTSFLTAAVQELAHARRNAHLTQEQVAQKLGKKQAAIARWEADFDGRMSLRQYVELAIAYDVMPLQMKLEPILSVRDYVLDNPHAQWTQEFYSEWQKKRFHAQTATISFTGHTFASFQGSEFTNVPVQVFSSNQDSVLTVKSIERFMKEKCEDTLLARDTKSVQQPAQSMRLTFTNNYFQGLTSAQSAA